MSAYKDIPVQQIFREAFQCARQNSFFLIVLTLIFLFSFSLVSYLPKTLCALVGIDMEGWVGTFHQLFEAVFQSFLFLGITRISILFSAGITPDYRDFLKIKTPLIRYLLASILYTAIVFGGMLLLVVPGIIWALKYQMYSFVIVDEEVGPVEALRKSAQLTDGAKMDLFRFGMMAGTVNMLGALFFLVGLFVTIPVTLLAMGRLYRLLVEQTESTL